MRYHELLTEVDINSTEFKQWFHGSKVIDLKTKAPLICYHGTTTSHEIQPGGEQHFGTFKAANDRILDKLGISEFSGINTVPMTLQDNGDLKNTWDAMHIYPVYLSIKTPIILEDQGEWFDPDVINQLFEQGLIDQKTVERFENAEDHRTWVDVCKELGYDGAVYENQWEDAGSTSWYPFSDHQVWNIFSNKPY